MKTFKNQAAQGDVMFTRISSLPKGLKEMLPEDGKLIITHSETGHHHVMAPDHVRAYQAANDPLMLFLVVDETTPLEHLREQHTHETIAFEPGIYRVNRQREYDPSSTAREIQNRYRLAID